MANYRMDFPSVEAAANGNAALRDFLLRLQQNLLVQEAKGRDVAPPVAASFEVDGVDGHYLITITNPQDVQPLTVAQRQQFQRLPAAQQNSFGGTIFHQLQSSTDIAFDAAGSVTTYGGDKGSPQLTYDITDPVTTKFWRMRSSYDGVNWNNWSYLIDPAVCGVVPVASGQLRSTSINPNSQNNVTNFATVDSIDAGTSATIRVYGTAGGVGSSFQRQVGAVLVGPDGTANTMFPSASLLGFAYSTHFTVLYDTTNNIYVAFTDSQYPQTLPDNLAFVGTVTTVASGGTGGTPGGGGTGGRLGGRYNTL